MQSSIRTCRAVRALAIALPTAALSLSLASAQLAPLPNGKQIALPSGPSVGVGSLPMNMVESGNGKFAVISDMGFRESLTTVDLATGAIAGSLSFDTSKAHPTNGLYYGLAADGDTIYAAQGGAGSVAVIQIDGSGSLKQTGKIQGEAGDFIAGVALDAHGHVLAVNNEYYDSVNHANPSDLTTPGSLAIYDAATGTQLGRVTFPTVVIDTALGPITPTSYPLSVAALSDGSKAFVSSQRDGDVYVVDTSNPAAPKMTASIATGAHPDYLLLSKDEKTLYVANASDDTVTLIDTSTNAATRTISIRPPQVATLPGATPTGLALSPDQKTLYVTLGDMNAVATVDLSTGIVDGYIPAGWYPSAALVTRSSLLVADAKGIQPRHPNGKPLGPKGAWGTYIQNIIEGAVTSTPLPSRAQLAADTHKVYAENRFDQLHQPGDGALRAMGVGSGKITHVVYIIKENRTYDQVLGDDARGNGDASLTLFGKNVTPNEHALADRFVLLDNFYDCSEVSGDGWNWSTQSYANEQVVKNIPYNYSGRGRNYDFEGQNNGYPAGGFAAKDPYGKPLSTVMPSGAPAITDVSKSPGGHIWDLAKAAKLPYRNYGFFYSFGVAHIIPDNYPSAPGLLPAGHDLSGVSDYDFRRFDLDYPDSEAPGDYFAKTGNSADAWPISSYGHYKAPSRFDEWKREFEEMLRADPSGKKVPALMLVRFMSDHTKGDQSSAHTPRSFVADNDYAVGELVDTLSKSPIWRHTAVFVIEDDAQDGEDHVDCHRSVCLVASPYIRKSVVDHGFYNTDSVLHTIEALLGVHAMSQYDAVAPVIADFDSRPSNDAPYDALLPAESIIGEHNPDKNKLQASDPRRALVLASDKMDFIHPDSAPADALNAIVWKTVKGIHSQPPAPRHTVIAPARTGE